MPDILPTTRRTPRSLLEAANITEQSRAVLDGQRKICLDTAFDLYIDARSQGYRPGARRLDTALGESWRRTSGANTKSAKRAWTRALGNPFFSHIEREDVVHALKEIRNLPKGHAKRRIAGDEKEGRISEEPIISHRIRITTLLKIGRAARQVGDFLVELELEDANPFVVCSWSRVEKARLRQQERPSDRHRWSDGVDSYLSSPIFRGDIQDAGDPLFWVPLLMRLGGLRVAEAVHLMTWDLKYRDGVPVLCIDQDTKTTASRREVPISRRLQDLGLVDLFELRRRQNETALFPQLASKRRGAGTTPFRRRFVRYCETYGIDASALHSCAFRKALHVELLGKGCPNDAVRTAFGYVSGETAMQFLDHGLLRAMREALSEAGADLPEIVGPFR